MLSELILLPVLMRELSTGKASGGGYPVGESQNQPFQLSFNRFLRVDFQGSRVTSDGGLILVRELDEQFSLSRLIREHLVDSRIEIGRASTEVVFRVPEGIALLAQDPIVAAFSRS
jgi:hypothetical protein